MTVQAPFTEEQVSNLNQYQSAGVMHPFTCGEAHKGEVLLVATTGGWVCADPSCDYTQDWAHGFMADGSFLANHQKMMAHWREKMMAHWRKGRE
jgi:hypothetical protein